MEHTRGKLQIGKNWGECTIFDGMGYVIASTEGSERKKEANAAELVRRWNAFPELLAACEEIATLHESGDVMASLFGGGGMLTKVQAALVAAKGGGNMSEKRCKDCVNKDKKCYQGEIFLGYCSSIPIIACIGEDAGCYKRFWWKFWRPNQ